MVEYRQRLDSINQELKKYIKIQDSLLSIRQAKINQYSNIIVPQLNTKAELLQQVIDGENRQHEAELNSEKQKVKKARAGGWKKLGVGLLLGLLIGIFGGG